MLCTESASCFLGSADSLAIMHRAEPLCFIEAHRRPFLSWIAGIVNRARSRAQLQIVLHVILQQCPITASAACPSYAHRRPVRKNIAGTGERCEGSAVDQKGQSNE